MNNEKLLLVDGNSILNRAFYGLHGSQLLSTSDGLYTNAVFGFLNILFKYLEEEQPQYICIAFDMKAPTFRHEQYGDYKANRKGMPEELAVQVPVIKEVLDAMNITRVEYEGYEADDLLGWLSLCGEKKSMEVVIITGDKDSFQLISNSTRIKLPITRYGKTETEEYDYNTFYDKYKIHPGQVIDVKALMGDASDNIPGIRGIGEKTALKLIREFESIENLYENIQQVDRESIKDKLEAGKEIAFLSKKLSTIKRDVPEELCNFDQLKIREYNTERLFEVFRRLEFKSFIEKLGLQKKVYESIIMEQGNQDNRNNKEVVYVKNLEELKNLKKLLINQKEISFFHLLDKSADNQNVNLAGDLVGLALSWSEKDSAFIKINSDKDKDDKNYKYAKVEAENVKTFNQISIDDRDVIDKDINKKGKEDKIKDDIGKYEDDRGISEKDFIREFRDIFENETIKKYGHDVKSFLLYLKDTNINLRGLSFDTMIGAYILNPAKETYLVAELCTEYLKKDIMPVEEISGKGKNYKFLKDVPCDNLIPVACGYSWAIFKLQKVIEKLIKENQQEILYYDIELPLIEILADMEYHGFKLNKDELISFSYELDDKIEYLTKEIYNLAGEEFNINSPKQLGVILFEKLGLPVKKKTKTGYSTAAEVLEQLIGEHVIIPHILEYRQLMKLKTTYTDGLISMINPETGKIHSKFNQTVVVTGRISSTEPNLQNIPIKLDMGRKVRKVFEPSDENFILIDADYSQIELRVLAHISEDENLIDAFMNNEDIHASTASKVFGVSQDKVTPLMRARAKAVNFGIIYGIGDFSLAKDLGITRKEARRYIDGYLDKYPGVRQYMHDIVTTGKELGYVTTMFNRRRYLPELTSSNFNIRSFGERIALNTPIQGSAADIIKIAMVKVYRRLKESNMKSRLILQVHDELIIETHVDEKDEVINILKECMETAVTLKIPLKVDISTGKNWYEVK